MHIHEHAATGAAAKAARAGAGEGGGVEIPSIVRGKRGAGSISGRQWMEAGSYAHIVPK